MDRANAEMRFAPTTPAGDSLAAAYGPLVHGVVLAHGPLAEVDDIVQDVFLTALEKSDAVRDPAAFASWLTTTARRRAIDALRRRRASTSPESEAADRRAARQASASAEAGEALEALRALPETYRETLALRLIEGLSGPEIAALTGLTPGSVRVNLHRGMALLRARLEGRPPHE